MAVGGDEFHVVIAENSPLCLLAPKCGSVLVGNAYVVLKSYQNWCIRDAVGGHNKWRQTRDLPANRARPSIIAGRHVRPRTTGVVKQVEVARRRHGSRLILETELNRAGVGGGCSDIVCFGGASWSEGSGQGRQSRDINR